MPVVKVIAKRRWYPSRPYWLLTRRQRVTCTIGQGIPDIIPEVLGFKTSEVVVIFTRGNRHDVNTPDIWITVTPMRNEQLEAAQRTKLGGLVLRIDLLCSLARKLGKKRWRRAVPVPQMDIELLFNTGCGTSLNTHGDTTLHW